MKRMKKLTKLFSMATLAMVGVLTGMALMGFEGKELVFGLPLAFAMPFAFGVVTFDQTTGTQASHQGGALGNRVFQLMSRVTIPLTAVTNDVIKAIKVQTGTKVLSTSMRLVTKSNGTAVALKLGDGDATGGYQNSTLDAVGGAVALTQTMLPADTNGVTPKVYSADDTIDVLCSTITVPGSTAAVVDVMALCEDTSVDPSAYTSPVVSGSA